MRVNLSLSLSLTFIYVLLFLSLPLPLATEIRNRGANYWLAVGYDYGDNHWQYIGRVICAVGQEAATSLIKLSARVTSHLRSVRCNSGHAIGSV